MVSTSETHRQRRQAIRLADFVVGARLGGGSVANAGQHLAEATSLHPDLRLVNHASRYAHPFTRDLLADWRRWSVGERIATCLLAALFLTAGPVGLVVATVGASI